MDAALSLSGSLVALLLAAQAASPGPVVPVGPAQSAAPGYPTPSSPAPAPFPRPAAAPPGAGQQPAYPVVYTRTTTTITTTVLRPAAEPRRRRTGASLPVVGFMGDAGLPDGFMGGLVVRPDSWLRLHAGAGTNSASPGFRGGLSLVPFGAGPSINIEVGRSTEGRTNGLVRAMLASSGSFGNTIERVSYSYGNAHLGLELGRQSATFFIHGGFSLVRATLHDVNDFVQRESDRSGVRTTTVSFYQDPVIRLITPSAKIGLILYLQ